MFIFWKVYQGTFSCVIHVHPSCFLLDMQRKPMKACFPVPQALLHGWRQWEPVDFCGWTEDQGQLPSIRWVKLLDDFLIVQLSQFYPSSLRVGTKGKRCNKRLGWQRRVQGAQLNPHFMGNSWFTHLFISETLSTPKRHKEGKLVFKTCHKKHIYNCSQILDIGCVCLPFENNDLMESNPLVVKTTIVSSWFGTPLTIIFADYFAHILQDQNFSKTRCWVPKISHLLN